MATSKSSQDSVSQKRSSRRSPIIKSDGVRMGTEDKVEIESYTLGERREVSVAVLEQLKKTHAKFLSNFEARLALYLRAEVEVELEEFSAAKYAKVAKQLDMELHLNLFKSDSATGAGFVGTEPKLALVAVNLLLGGKGDAPKEERALTKIESDLSQQLANELIASWRNVWKDDLEFEPKVYDQAKRLSQFTQCDPHTPVFYLKTKLKIRETEGVVCLVYPLHMIAPVVSRLQDLDKSKASKAHSISKQWSPVYSNVRVGAEVFVSAGRISIEDFLGLESGSVLELPDQAMDKACLQFRDQRFFEGSFGLNADRLALAIKSKLQA